MAGLGGNEPDLPLLRQCAGRGDVLTTSFPLKEFLLDILPCGGAQGGLLDGDPEKSVIISTGPHGLNPGDSSRGSGVGPSWCYQHRLGHTDNANYCLVPLTSYFSPSDRFIFNCPTDKAATRLDTFGRSELVHGHPLPDVLLIK